MFFSIICIVISRTNILFHSIVKEIDVIGRIICRRYPSLASDPERSNHLRMALIQLRTHVPTEEEVREQIKHLELNPEEYYEYKNEDTQNRIDINSSVIMVNAAMKDIPLLYSLMKEEQE